MSWDGTVSTLPEAGERRLLDESMSTAGLGLGLRGQRHVHGHLVAVEVRVEGGAHQRVQVDGLALNENRLEGLDGETVQGRCAVEKDQAILDHLGEHVPHGRHLAVDGTLGALDVLDLAELHEAAHHERLEELEGHLRGQAALMQLELRVDDDDRAAGVVDALAQEVLAEAALLALEGLGEGLERATATTGDGTARRPLSKSASTDSWSMRFSLLTMIAGASRSSRRLRRLLRLMTRR